MSETGTGKPPLLSKSRFVAGLQCHKRLYFECFHRDLADPVAPAQQAIFDMGTGVGELARNLYAGGVLVDSDHFHHSEAVARTTELLSDSTVPAIFEAGFLHDGIRIRADILARAGGGVFDLLEVKSTTSVKEAHLTDAAVQLYVLTGCGISAGRTCLVHLNKEYIYLGGDYDLNKLFSVAEITDAVLEAQPEIQPALEAMRSALRGPEAPDIKTGKHCSKPYTCPFYGHCHVDEPEHHASQLPRANQKLLLMLEEAGIEDIRAIPADFSGLNELQQRVRDCVAGNRVHLDGALAASLGQLEYPVHFLDFETFNPALPLYVGTRPYQVIPFQWSDHIMDRDGNFRHEEFLHDGFDDPRESFAKSLLEALGTSGAIVVYSSFEETRIRELAAALPALASGLLDLLNGRIFDLLPLVRKYCYHPEFHGSFSLKSVLPALVPDFGYGDLKINDGGLASAAYAEMIRPETIQERRGSLRRNLLAYCERDTEAMVRLFRTFNG